ncbi:hypothetical protein SDD30_12055 [Moorella naiadis]|uniref:hypothetical protein n=1 Tax=Moorella naiadis (nom. illeg.) TaxID=3093670 RepID=UPI003D9CB901
MLMRRGTGAAAPLWDRRALLLSRRERQRDRHLQPSRGIGLRSYGKVDAAATQWA